jgi:hypothetical protein
MTKDALRVHARATSSSAPEQEITMERLGVQGVASGSTRETLQKLGNYFPAVQRSSP